MKLKTDKDLYVSSVVANCRMNRERQVFGENSYSKDISLNPYTFLTERIKKRNVIKWLDICCGQAKALIQVSLELKKNKIEQGIELWGIDLVGMFDNRHLKMPNLHLIESPLSEFQTKEAFDLITCVHGLHYLGDKLKIIKKYIHYLKKDGVFIGNLDTNTIFDKNGKSINKKINSVFRKSNLEYNARKKILYCRGKKNINFPFIFVGANDKYGKIYTGQEAVSSYYELLENSNP